jgi:hypothetical protein
MGAKAKNDQRNLHFLYQTELLHIFWVNSIWWVFAALCAHALRESFFLGCAPHPAPRS